MFGIAFLGAALSYIVLSKLASTIGLNDEFKGIVPLFMDILASLLGQGLFKDKKRRSSLKFLLAWFIATFFILVSAYEGQIRASLISVELEKPVETPEVIFTFLKIFYIKHFAGRHFVSFFLLGYIQYAKTVIHPKRNCV